MALGAVFALVITFLVIFLLRFVAYYLVWSIIIGFLLIVFGIAAFFIFYGNHIRDEHKITGIILMVVGAVVLLYGVIKLVGVCLIRRSISISLRVIEAAGEVLIHNPLSVIVPVFYFLVEIIFILLFVVSTIFYLSLCISWKGIFIKVNFSAKRIVVFVLLVLFFYWTTWVVIALMSCTLAGIGILYYFTRNKRNVPSYLLLRSTKILYKNNLGSAIAGAAFLCLLSWLRKLLDSMEKKYQKGGRCRKCLCCCIHCITKLLLKFIQYLSTFSYVIVMLSGKSFFSSAKHTAKLTSFNLSNLVTTAVMIDMVSTIITRIIIFIVVICTFLCVLILRPDFFNAGERSLDIKYWWAVALFAFLFAVITTFIIINVYEMMVNTIYICFLEEDAIASDHTSYIPYADDNLTDILLPEDSDRKRRSAASTSEDSKAEEKQMH